MMKRTIIISALILLSLSIFAQKEDPATAVEIGGTTSYTEFEEDGTIEFHGDATVWNDYVVPFASVKLKGTKEPSWEPFLSDINQYNFEAGAEQEVGMSIQLPHDWDGSAIYPHIHWAPEDGGSGNVIWAIDYTWVNYMSEFPAPVTLEVTTSISGDEKRHRISEFSAISPMITGDHPQNGISSILLIRFYRKGNDSGDTYNKGAYALSFDIHYRSNTIGSRQEYIK